MRRRVVFISVVILLWRGSLCAQMQVDVLGSHNLSPAGTSPVQGQSSAACLYCHAPHSGIGGNTPLWAQTLSTRSYTLYSSTTLQNVATQPTVGNSSSLCLSCHDGTVAVGTTVPYGTLTMTGSMHTQDVLGTQLQSSHPFSLKIPLADSPDLVASLAATQTTADPLNKVKLVNGTVECSSCHEPHAQNLDPISLKFLVRDSINGQLCLACHTGTARSVNGKTNPLSQWSSSIHAVSGNVVNPAAGLGEYSTVAQFACLSCHKPHNANGAAGLLRAPVPPATGVDAPTQSCMACHSGGPNLQQPIANVYGEFAKKGHPLPAGSSSHDANEPVALINNRHATCADCHNGHASFQVASFDAPPTIRVSQTGITGISATDGTTVLNPAINQYENCLRCHGNSPGKQALQVFGYFPLRAVNAPDPLNVIPQLAPTATSSHPVLHTASSPWPQISLRAYILNLDGTTNSPRQLGSGARIFCTDCHNSDDNREFGGPGPNGPHGSQYDHILERRYEFSQVAIGAGPGSPIQNLFPNPDLSAGGASPGPYALCAKCHDLANVMTSASFALPKAPGHDLHVVQQGVSCSVCHTAHGMGSLSADITGERMVNFDLNVVAPNGASPASYSHPTNTCVLACHGFNHNPDGSVSAIGAVATGPLQKVVRSR
ncbi:MAG: cytochrome c3 family protein [Terriglobia bacterium]